MFMKSKTGPPDDLNTKPSNAWSCSSAPFGEL